MEEQNLRQRSTAPAAASPATNDGKPTRDKKLIMARRGLRSLSVAISVPLLLSLLSFSLYPQPPATKPRLSWLPPAWVMHTVTAFTACLMALAAWLVWADGGMQSPAVASLYAAQLALGLAWAPMVRAGPAIAGIGIAATMAAVQAGCSRCFRRVNPVAGDLVVPCIAWAAFMTAVSYAMM
ncbi:Translocator protein like [Apostasia shenzhenica]|uniref:Translocator protein like n=1 Tax=Apostasia shenzhenica TaxID=1088818 RepID=A0A2I0A093_9ASPA|nr:Translocator protein like [Apostasia shenzhenica]